MKANDYNTKLDNTPKFISIFEVIKVPDWAKYHGIKIGDKTNEWGTVKGCHITPTYLKFIEYKQIKGEEQKE